MVGEPGDPDPGDRAGAGDGRAPHGRRGTGWPEATTTDATLARFAAEARIGEAVRAKSRERWMRQRSTADTTVPGVCWSLAEAGQPLMLTTVAGRTHQGVVRSLGEDFVGLADGRGGETLVPFAMIATLSPGRATAAPTGRPSRAGVRLADALGDLAGERPLVRAWCLGAKGSTAGELIGASEDVVLIAAEHRAHGVVYVRVASLCELSLTASG
jgi:hypothetical protein